MSTMATGTRESWVKSLRKCFASVLAVSLGTCTGACTKPSEGGSTADSYSLSLEMTRTSASGLSPFQVTVALKRNGTPASGQSLVRTVPKGAVTATIDNGDGTYSFTVTPSATGTYPVTIAFGDASITRKAIVLDTYVSGSGQPMAVPGDYVNTDGYEDGVTITPDGQYLFVQYGPWYMSGILNFLSLCSSGAYSSGYDLNTCAGRTNSFLVFDTLGPYANSLRPGFPTGGISAGKLRHLPSLVIGGVANGIVAFPTVFYGFKKQADGTFAEPFKVAFNDERGVNGPFGLSFKLNGDGTAVFALAWNNYFNDLGDDKPDIYTGTMTLGQNTSLGDVGYSGEMFSSITPTISPVGFSSHTGVQGNPHLYYDGSGAIKSVWVDDEQITHDLSVYRLTSGTYPNGTWVKDALPSVINTVADEDQPFFTGDRLIFSRDNRIVSHAYQPTNGACASGFTHGDCWGPEVVLIGANGHTAPGEIFAVGEPTIAVVSGKKYLYFVYIEARANANLSGGVVDWNADAGFVEVP